MRADGPPPLTNGWTARAYAAFRLILGAYLCVHFAQLIPWAAELFSSRGVLPDGGASPLLHAFPNLLALADGPAFVTALVFAAAGASAAFALGIGDRVCAVFLWYVLACLFGRNPLIANPSLPYVGLLLLTHAALPPLPREPWEGGRRATAPRWRLPQPLFVVVWVLMALGYSYSGWTKLGSPSWLDGSALTRVLDNPLARDGELRELLLTLPAWVRHDLTWLTLGFELLFAPLALFRRLRPWLWGAGLAMHLGLIVLIDFADLSLGMVMLHLFTFDPRWLPGRRAQVQRTQAVAGAAA